MEKELFEFQLTNSLKDLNWMGDASGTHKPVLRGVIDKLSVTRPLKVLELGCGLNSTPILVMAKMQGKVEQLITIDSDPQWALKMEEALKINGNNSHKINTTTIEDWYHTLRPLKNIEFDFIFVDSSPWSSRTMALDLFIKSKAVFLVHDVDYFPHNGIWGRELQSLQNQTERGRRIYSEFSFWAEFFPNQHIIDTGPPTLIASNHVDVSTWEFSDSVNYSNSKSFPL
jgi:hypothetical protein